MNNVEKLNMLRMIYGPDVVCTNGLFHIINDKHEEIYISNAKNELDKRTKYKTLEVLDNSIIALDLSSEGEFYLGNNILKKPYDISDSDEISRKTTILMDKDTLEYKYKTPHIIKHIVNNTFLVSDTQNSAIIDNNGKTKLKLENCGSLISIGNNLYICEGNTLFSDKLIIIYSRNKVLDITKARSYRIKFIKDNRLRIELRSGGAYILDLKTKEYFNVFTGKIETNLNLFDIAI